MWYKWYVGIIGSFFLNDINEIFESFFLAAPLRFFTLLSVPGDGGHVGGRVLARPRGQL
jgi:hypothetical protein